MPKSSSFVTCVLHQLNQLAPVTARAMFGGHGLYAESLMFALIADEQIYLKADALNQDMFIQAGSTPFVYDRKDKPIVMSYYLLPQEVFDDMGQLRIWLESAIDAAGRNQAKKKAQSRRL